MTPARLRLLDELLDEFRTEHAPMWLRPHCTTLRHDVRRVADAETAAAAVPIRSTSMALACPVTWDGRRLCDAWGAPSFHGCGQAPNHDGDHRCPCGSRHPDADPADVLAGYERCPHCAFIAAWRERRGK